MHTRVVLALMFSLALVGGWASAQIIPNRLESPVVVSGNDVGFRIEARRGSTPVGRVVIRVDGKWVEADFAGGATRLGTR